MARITGSFTVVSWSEDTYHEDAAGKLTSAVVAQSFDGDVNGQGTARWLMSYRPDGTARFVGLQLIEGVVEGRHGSFVMETLGDFDGKTARWEASVVEDSATDGLRGLRGRGRFGAEHGPEATYDLDLEVPT